MDPVQNLRKTLSNWVSKILADLSSAFIRRRAKLILKKPANYSEIKFSPSPLTTGLHSSTIATYSVGITEKTTMEEMTTEDIVKSVSSWAIDRIEFMTKSSVSSQRRVKDALAIADEFKEWFEDDGNSYVDIMSIEEY